MASLADAYKPNRREGMEHAPRPVNPWPAVNSAAASLAQYIPGAHQRGSVGYDESGNLVGYTPQDAQLSSLVGAMFGTGAAPTAMARNTPGLLHAIGVWHGSPHKFDKFDMSKIGTGEGAQAYGHGLYFAESPAVADAYRQALSPGRGADHADVAARIIDAAGGDTAKALEIVGQRRKIGNLPGAQERWDAVESLIRGGVDPRGSLYRTSLEWPDAAREAADPLGPQHFLDWDLPLAGTPHRDLLRQIPEIEWWQSDDLDNEFGGMAYEQLAKKLGAAQASHRMRDLGIPGIRYLDQGSRGAGEGTHNYVVFSDSLAKILERNGIPVGR